MDLWSEETKARHRTEIDATETLLVQSARRRQTITYGELRQRVPGINFRTEGPILGTISIESNRTRGVMLSAVVVDITGQPGDGFFTLAQVLGRSVDDRRSFHQQELNRVFQEYAEQRDESQ